VVVEVTCITDPMCPWSWGAEPAVRRLQAEFGDEVRFTYVMGGLAREFRRPVETLAHMLDAAHATGMPVDPRLWLQGPPRSSYPVCLAVRAAGEQGLDGAYLRRAREGLMCERRALDHPDALVELAREVPGLDVERFAIDVRSNAILERFGADLERARPGGERLPFPTFEVAGERVPRDGLVTCVAAAGATSRPLPVALEALTSLGRLAAVEVAAACDLPGPRASAELWRLALEWRARPVRFVTGELWQAY
jgi:predicted DsbA family dithiol-disulfide isomerase